MGIIIIPHAVFIHSEVIAIIATQKNYEERLRAISSR